MKKHKNEILFIILDIICTTICVIFGILFFCTLGRKESYAFLSVAIVFLVMAVIFFIIWTKIDRENS